MKKLIFFFFLLLFSSTILAEDEQLFIPLFGDSQAYFLFEPGDIQLNNYFISLVQEEEEPSAGGRGGTYLVYSTLYYDVILSGVESKYNPEDIINFNITIINKGYTPDRDGTLVYYLTDKNNKTYSRSQEVFEVIPPTCPRGIYNRYENICEEGNNTFEPLLYSLERYIPLPLNTTEGEWTLYVEYETNIQPKIKVYKSFRVGGVDYEFLIWTLFVIIIISPFLIYARRRKKRENAELPNP